MSKTAIGLALAAAFAVTIPANAKPLAYGTGCNGVINIFVWGCAPWDNNNGPNYPYFKKKAVTVPKKGSQIVTEKGVRMVLYNGNYYPLVGNDGASLIGNDTAGFRVWSQ